MKETSFVEIEDFLIDSTFQQYCAEENSLSTAYWERYIEDHPHQLETILQAKQLYHILSAHARPIPKQLATLKEKIHAVEERVSLPTKTSWRKWFAAAAILLALATFSYWWISGPERTYNQTVANIKQKVIKTNKGEKKQFTLMDGTIVTLNSASELRISKTFNQEDRRVTLKGEGYFEVAKNAEKPFYVETQDFDIRVLGTVFNVKSYPEDKESEAFLLEGLIEMQSKDKNSNAILIKPNQRVSIGRGNKQQQSTKQQQQHNRLKGIPAKEILIHELQDDLPADEIADIAWKNGRLVMTDQDFLEVKQLLERWYNVEIELNDADLDTYRFTATFSKENIQQALEALQKVQPFKFKLYGEKITITKN